LAVIVEIYLHMFQKRLSGVGNGFHKGGSQGSGKDFHSICSESQTCYNVVQSNLSESGVGRHLGGESSGFRENMLIFIAFTLGELSLSFAVITVMTHLLISVFFAISPVFQKKGADS
jgi:hypothetical protein